MNISRGGVKKLTAFVVIGIVAGVFLLTPATILASFGIDPGKVYIDNLYPGGEADVPITIYNQQDEEKVYRIEARQPDYTEEGYEALPYLDWITVTPYEITIGPGKHAEVTVAIHMPDAADYYDKKAETWISFKEQDAPDMIQIELCSRLLISTVASTSDETLVEGEGSVGITAEAADKDTGITVSTWAILGGVLGAIIVGVITFFWISKRHS